MGKRAAIYYRVSTADQSPDAQISELREYAQQRGFVVVEEFLETASGATRSRPELDRLMELVGKRKVDVVLVWAFDRFARSTSHLSSTLEEFQNLGVGFVAFRQQIDTTTPAGKLTFHVLAAIAEFEREMIKERVRSGMAAAKVRGTRSGNPLGRPKLTASTGVRHAQVEEGRGAIPEDRQEVGHVAGDGGQLHRQQTSETAVNPGDWFRGVLKCPVFSKKGYFAVYTWSRRLR
jgi:DNA invertase Pin-like site-specific DNA recombinase